MLVSYRERHSREKEPIVRWRYCYLYLIWQRGTLWNVSRCIWLQVWTLPSVASQCHHRDCSAGRQRCLWYWCHGSRVVKLRLFQSNREMFCYLRFEPQISLLATCRLVLIFSLTLCFRIRILVRCTLSHQMDTCGSGLSQSLVSERVVPFV